MDERDEQRPDEEEIAEATSEPGEESPDVEGHKWAHGAVEAVSEPDKADKAY
jgi:hypothetical protein